MLHSVIHSASGLVQGSDSVSGLGSASRSVSDLGLASRSVSDLGSASHSVSDLGLASHQRRFHSISLLRYSQALPLLPDLPDRLLLPYAADTVLLQHLPDLHCNPVLPHYSYNPPDCLHMYHIHHSDRQQGLPAAYNDLPALVLYHSIWMLHGDADILPHSHYSRLQNNVLPDYFQAGISSVQSPSYCNYRLSWITSGLPDHRSVP